MPRMFQLPPIVRPTFDSNMMDAPPDIGPVQQPMPPLPPPQRMPPPPSMPLDATQQMARQQPPPMPNMSGWRGYVGSFLQGGAPGLAQHAIDPGYRQKQMQYAAEQQAMADRAKAEQVLATQARQQDVAVSQIEANRARAEAAQAQVARNTAPRAEAVGSHGYYDRDGAFHAAPERPMQVAPGASLMSPQGGVLGTAPNRPAAPPRPSNVSRGGTLVGPDGKVVYQDTRPPASPQGPSGSFVQMQDAEGGAAFYNPTTGEIRKAPEGLRKPVTEVQRRQSAAQQTFIAEAKTLEGMIDRLQANYGDDNDLDAVGYFAAPIAKKRREITGGGSDEGFKNTELIANITAKIRSELFGAALTPLEYQTAQGFIPEANESPRSVISKMQGLKQFLASKRQNLQGLSQQTGSGGGAALAVPPAATGGQPVKMTSPDGSQTRFVKPDKVAEMESQYRWKRVQ